MNAFEREIDKTFQAYRDGRVATLHFMNPPMRIAGMHGRVPCFVQSGKAPYDVAGWYYDSNATSIGAELKETSGRELSLSIVHPDKRGSGLQYHQLEGLVNLHKEGGIALLAWSNGGEVGVIKGDHLALVKVGYDASLKAEGAGKMFPKGVRSIPWAMFRPVKYDEKDRPLWLPKAPAPCKRGVA